MKKLKKCPTCKEEKEATPEFFARHVTRKDGLSWQCKICRVISDQRYRKTAKAKILDTLGKKRLAMKKKSRAAARAKWGKANHLRTCAVLGCEDVGIDLHHIDYSLPLDVIPICRRHHEYMHHNE